MADAAEQVPAAAGRAPVAVGQADAPAPTRVRPARNASYMTVGNIGAKAFGSLLLFYAPRALGKDSYGAYTAIIAFVGLFEILTDLGLTNLVVRNVAQDPSSASRYVSNVLALRVALSVVAILLIFALTPFMSPYPAATYIYALYLAPLAAGNVLQAVFQFSERLSYSAAFNLAMNGARVTLSILVLALGHKVLALMVVATAVTAANTAAIAWVVYTRFLPRRLDMHPSWWPALLWSAVPFAMLSVLNVLYTRADALILNVLTRCSRDGALCGPVALYGAATRGLDIPLVVFVGGIQAGTLPLFMRIARESRAELARLVRSTITIMLVLGVPFAIFGASYAREAMYLIGSRQFVAGAPALAVLVWGFPCVLVVNILYMALYAVNKQSVVTAAFAANLVFNAGLNIALIPRYSYMASAALTVASEVLNGVIVLTALRRAIGPLGLGPAALKALLVGAMTAAALWLTRGVGPFDGIVAGLPLGLIVFVAGLRATRLLGATEREILGTLPLVGRYAALVF